MNCLTSKINSLVNLKLFNRLSNLKKTVTSLTFFSVGIKFYVRSRESGMMLVEVILIAVFLLGTALGATYFFTQTEVTMKSSSQVIECQTIVKQALEDVVSLGTRLYGYKIKHDTSNLSYTPLFITKDSKAYNVDDNIKDVGDGSELSFPPEMYQELYRNLVGMDIDPPIKVSPESNTGKPIISDRNTHPIEVSTSTLIVNSTNVLQYLYNADPAYSTGDGKLLNNNNGLISSVLQKYKEQFDLSNIELYLKITPVKGNTVISTMPVLTRPYFLANSNEISSDLTILGEAGIGFEVRVKLQYESNNQEFTCDGAHQFHHQTTGESGNPTALDVTLKGLKNGTGKDFLQDASLVKTSCDTYGGGYEDITVTLDFNTLTKSQQFGTVILCQMNTYCRSEGDDGDYTDPKSGAICTPEKGRFQRCHNINPKPSSDQEWTFKSKLESEQVLVLQFNDMKDNRRYDLNVAEFALDGEILRSSQKFIFYIDERRPYVGDRQITGDDVGLPTDNIKERDYNGPFTNWKKPVDSPNDKWLQCNKQPVDFGITIEDQFTHNLRNCDISWKREDGAGSTSSAPVTSTFDSPNGTCKGSLGTIEQGRQTIQFNPKDTCEPGPWNTENLVWDTDLPSSYKVQDFPSTIWLPGNSQDGYAIDTIVPAKNQVGKLPKHYSVDCQENYMGNNPRDDGDGKPLQCKIINTYAGNDDGAKLNTVGVRYYHVCGNQGKSCQNTTKRTDWGIYNPDDSSCDVTCGPQSSCCRGLPCEFDYGATGIQKSDDVSSPQNRLKLSKALGDCVKISGSGCYTSTAPTTGAYVGTCMKSFCSIGCSNPVGGTQTGKLAQGEGGSVKDDPRYPERKTRQDFRDNDPGCPPSGVCNCSYNAPCKADQPFEEYERVTSSCNGLREGADCSFTQKYRCQLDNPARQTTDAPYSGTCVYLTMRTGPVPMGVSCTVPARCTNGQYKRDNNGNLVFDANGQMIYECLSVYEPGNTFTCSISFTGGKCPKPSGNCTPNDGDMTGEAATSRDISCIACDSSTTCCPGDSSVTNPNCP